MKTKLSNLKRRIINLKNNILALHKENESLKIIVSKIEYNLSCK